LGKKVCMETIVVTGANRGIGLALTRVLVANGKRVVAICRRPEESTELKRLAVLHPERLDLVKGDVDHGEELEEAAAATQKRHEKLDVIFNNAGIMPERGDESILKINLRVLRLAYETNVLGAARVIRAFYPMLARSERPRILNVSSGLSSISTKDDYAYYAYSISKAALNMLTRAVAHEFAPHGITTVAISPGWVRTDMGGEEAELSPEESAESLAQAMDRIGPELNGQFLDRYGRMGAYSW
jgi:NAD(P)-dependent dehydrogenase (short-subunit alcohol dehydrogenase family)